MANPRERTIRRIPPCPYYDIERVESWLSDLAEEGLFLEPNGISCGLANFQRGEPRSLPYRLVPAVKTPTVGQMLMGSEQVGVTIGPEEEERELHTRYGWDYVARWQSFFIYRAQEERVRELNTDPQVQAMAIHAVERWRQLDILSLFLPLVLVWMGTRPDVVGLFYAAPVLLISTVCILAWMVFYCLFRIFHLARLRRNLQQGQELDHKKTWKQQGRRFIALKFTGGVLLVVWCVSAILTNFS